MLPRPPSAHLAPRLRARTIPAPRAGSWPGCCGSRPQAVPLSPQAGLGGLGSSGGGAFSSSTGSPCPGGTTEHQRALLRPGAWGLVLPVPSPAGQRPGLPHSSCHRPAYLEAREPRGLSRDPQPHPAPRRSLSSCRPGKWTPLHRRPAPSRRGRRAPGTWREPWNPRPRRPGTQETPAADKGPGSPAPPCRELRAFYSCMAWRAIPSRHPHKGMPSFLRDQALPLRPDARNTAVQGAMSPHLATDAALESLQGLRDLT